jgi:hypothetical protein
VLLRLLDGQLQCVALFGKPRELERGGRREPVVGVAHDRGGRSAPRTLGRVAACAACSAQPGDRCSIFSLARAVSLMGFFCLLGGFIQCLSLIFLDLPHCEACVLVR